MSLNTLLRRKATPSETIVTLFNFYAAWINKDSANFRRNALRCQTMALVYQDRNQEIRDAL